MTFYTFTALTAFLGALASMIIGFVWYGPFFGKKWGEIVGMPAREAMSDADNKAFGKKMIPLYLLNMLVAFVQFYAIGFFAAFIGGITASGALLYGFFIWFGFVMPIQAGMAIWSGKSRKLSWTMFGISAGYQLVIIILGAVIWSVLYSTIIL